MDTVNTLETQALGNTIPVPTPTVSPDSRSRGFVMTINNYTDTLYTSVLAWLKMQTKYIIGKEVGDEKKTPHLQIYVYMKNAKKFSQMKELFPTAHIEKAVGRPEANYKYCSKGGDFVTNMEKNQVKKETLREILVNDCLNEYKEAKWKPWQQAVLDLKREDRKIHWYWDLEGNKGKTYLAKYLACKKGTVVCSGKKGDIFNQVNTCIQNGIKPEILIADISRSEFNKISYTALEQVKNGMLYSGKYEGGLCIFPSPIVVVFANALPDNTKLSTDRWIISEVV